MFLFILCLIYRDLSNNILEKLPLELFLNTRNLTELYVLASSECSRTKSFLRILAARKLELEQKKRNEAGGGCANDPPPAASSLFLLSHGNASYAGSVTR